MGCHTLKTEKNRRQRMLLNYPSSPCLASTQLLDSTKFSNTSGSFYSLDHWNINCISSHTYGHAQSPILSQGQNLKYSSDYTNGHSQQQRSWGVVALSRPRRWEPGLWQSRPPSLGLYLTRWLPASCLSRSPLITRC